AFATSLVAITGGEIRDNAAEENGGGIALFGGVLQIAGGLLTGNQAGQDKDADGERLYFGDGIYYAGGDLHVAERPRIGDYPGDNGVYLAVSSRVGTTSSSIKQDGDLLAGSNINIEGKSEQSVNDLIALKSGGSSASFEESNYYRWLPGGKLRLIPGTSIQYRLANATDLYVASVEGRYKGNDAAGRGTVERPFATIERAFDMANPNEYINVHVMDMGVVLGRTASVRMGQNITLQRWHLAQEQEIIVTRTGFDGTMIEISAPADAALNGRVPGGLTLRDLTLSGGGSAGSGPLVSIAPGAVMYMFGGGLANNAALSGEPAAVTIGADAALYMRGGLISGHSTDRSVIEILDGGSFVMEAGSIRGNTVGTGSGAVGLRGAASSFAMGGGEIVNTDGGGYGLLYTSGSFSVSGGARVLSGRGAGQGVYMGGSQVITVLGDLAKTAMIEVTEKVGAGTETVIARKEGAPVSESESRQFYWEPRTYTIMANSIDNTYILDRFSLRFLDAWADGVQDLADTGMITLRFDEDIEELDRAIAADAAAAAEYITLTYSASNIEESIRGLPLTAGVVSHIGAGLYTVSVSSAIDDWKEGDRVDVQVGGLRSVHIEPDTVYDVILHRYDSKLEAKNYVKQTWDHVLSAWGRPEQDFVDASTGILRYRIAFDIPESEHLFRLEIQDFIPDGLVLADPALSECVRVYFEAGAGGPREDISASGMLLTRYNDTAVCYLFDFTRIDLARHRGERVYMEIDFAIAPGTEALEKVQNSGRILVNKIAEKEEEVDKPSVGDKDLHTEEQAVLYGATFYRNNGATGSAAIYRRLQDLRVGDTLADPGEDLTYGNGRYAFRGWYTEAFPPGAYDESKKWIFGAAGHTIRGNTSLYAAYDDTWGLNAAKETWDFSANDGEGGFVYHHSQIVFSESEDVRYRIGFTLSPELLGALESSLRQSLVIQDILPALFKPPADAEDLAQRVKVSIGEEGRYVMDPAALSLDVYFYDAPGAEEDRDVYVISYTFHDLSALREYIGMRVNMDLRLAIDGTLSPLPAPVVNIGRILLDEDPQDPTLPWEEIDEPNTEVNTPEQEILYEVIYHANGGAFPPLSRSEGQETKRMHALLGKPTGDPGRPAHPEGYSFLGWFLQKSAVNDAPAGLTAWLPDFSNAEAPLTVYALWSEPVFYDITVQYYNTAGLLFKTDILKAAHGEDFRLSTGLKGYLLESWKLDGMMQTGRPPEINLYDIHENHSLELTYRAVEGGAGYVAVYRSWATSEGLDLGDIYPEYKDQPPLYLSVEEVVFTMGGGTVPHHVYKGYKWANAEITSGFSSYTAGMPYAPLVEGLVLFVTYIYESDGSTPGFYAVTVEDSYAEDTGAGVYRAGEPVVIQAGSRSGYRFIGWRLDAGDAVLANANAPTTSFVMPAGNVALTAMWSPTGGGGDGGGDGGGPGFPGDPGDPGGGGDGNGNGGGDGGDSGSGSGGGTTGPGGSTPTPTTPGHTLVPDGEGGYLEYDSDGNLVGIWRWDEENQVWVFTAEEPFGPLPKTGDPGNPFFTYLLIVFALACLATIGKAATRSIAK
ncbi:MAG: InlB B-repeat-containing protein, partial [Clostridiales bacterium]|nr:InlB B-repeat-containing protein [Clostridiales bacterium]